MADLRLAADRLLRALRGHCTATLLIQEDHGLTRGAECRYIIDGASGRLVLPADTLDLHAGEGVLCVPREHAGALQLTVDMADATDDPATGHAIDRWTAYHQAPRRSRPRWVAASVLSARLGPDVAGGEELRLVNPLHGTAEHALCRLANADPSRLGAMVRARVGAAPALPRAVGVDPLGVDVRCDFAVARVAFDRPALDEPAARAALSSMLDDPRPLPGSPV